MSEVRYCELTASTHSTTQLTISSAGRCQDEAKIPATGSKGRCLSIYPRGALMSQPPTADRVLTGYHMQRP